MEMRGGLPGPSQSRLVSARGLGGDRRGERDGQVRARFPDLPAFNALTWSVIRIICVRQEVSGMARTAARREKWTLSFDAGLKRFLVKTARRRCVYPVTYSRRSCKKNSIRTVTRTSRTAWRMSGCSAGARVGPPTRAFSRKSGRGSEQSVDRLLQAALDLVATGAVHVLVLADRVRDVAVLADELLEREHRPPVGLGEGAELALLERGHRQDQVGGGDDLSVLAEVRGEDLGLREVDPVLAEQQARVEGRDHAVARGVTDAARPDPHAAVPLREHLFEQRLGHHAPTRVRVADDQDGLHGSSQGDCQNRIP